MRNENKSDYSRKQHDPKLQKSLDVYSVQMIRIVGVVGVVLGIAVIGAFWYWVIKMLFRVGA